MRENTLSQPPDSYLESVEVLLFCNQVAAYHPIGELFLISLV